MNVRDGIDGLKQVPQGAVMSIGNFDGLHVGHRRILDTMKSLRDAMPAHPPLAVVTFEPHPLTVLRPQLAPPRLSPYPMKQQLLENAGIDELVVLPPTRQVLDLTAEAFWEVLTEYVRPTHLVEGASFNFGKGRGGTIKRLRELAAQSQVHLHVIDAVLTPLMDLQVAEVSSSLIRWLISYGRVRDAAVCLGRPYTLQGTVVRGYGRGRQIGIPTANLSCLDQLIPADGVYAGRCALDGDVYPVALSIGTMPTFGENQRQIEAHLIGFDGDLYDQVIEVQLLDWLRDQLRFSGVAALKAQLALDLLHVREMGHLNPILAPARLAAG
jgi:riboflavin kinase/FMN adenylyltransferase